MAEDLWAGRYRRDRLLGRGAMGEVWAAHDVVLDRTVAIKSIAAELTEPADLERMTREARVAARIAHPNAVGVFDLVTVDGRPSLVMEYVDGTTLDDLITQRGRLAVAEVERIGAAVAAALAEAHRLGVVHRDIKPANILVTSRGVPKLADFGIARGTGDASVTATGATIGTPAYLAPEILQGTAADPRTDVWALGVTLYAALEGASPFVLSRHDDPLVVLGRVLTAPVPPTGVRGPLGDVISAMLDRDPERRPTADQVSGVLHRSGSPDASDTARLTPTSGTTRLPANRQELPYAPPPRETVDRTRRKSRRRYLLVAAAVVVLGAGGTAAALLRPGHTNPSPEAGAPGPTQTYPRSGAEPGHTYRGPSGIEVTGPTGWARDTTQTSSRLADYLSPGTTERHHGLYFRLGIDDPDAASGIKMTAKRAREFLLDPDKGKLTGTVIVSSTYARFLGARAVDIEFTGTNTYGIHRHGIERLWNADGITREIQVNGTPAQWKTARPLFGDLVDSCRVAG